MKTARTARSQVSASDRRPEQQPILSWSHLRSPLGRLFVAVSERGLCAIVYRQHEDNFVDDLRSRATLKRDSTATANISAQLDEYFVGQRKHFDLAVDLSELTPFQRQVLAVTARIPFGEVWTYRQVADALKHEKASRPVGQALGRNPIPIVIPCHRVIASDGSLGGYCGTSRLEIKRWLLRHEGIRL